MQEQRRKEVIKLRLTDTIFFYLRSLDKRFGDSERIFFEFSGNGIILLINPTIIAFIIKLQNGFLMNYQSILEHLSLSSSFHENKKKVGNIVDKEPFLKTIESLL